MHSFFESLASHIVMQIPLLLVYIAAIAACAIYWRRCPTASLLTLLATVGLFVLTVGTALLFSYLLNFRQGPELGQVLQAIAIVESCFHAGAFGLLVFAVFQGRQPRPYSSGNPEGDPAGDSPSVP